MSACGGSGKDPEKPATPPDNGNVISPIKPGGDFNVGSGYSN